MEKINLAQKFSQFSEYWTPKIIGELNGQHVKVVKLKGEFVSHHHDNEDELFLVLKGKLAIEFNDRTIEANEGELIIIPKGTEHRPVAREEAHVLLFEPASTLNTGNLNNEVTVESPDRI